jgi:predicted nucleic acid-binding protein
MVAIGKIIVDSGPLVGFLDKWDQWHDWTVARFAELPGPFLTCEAVLSEACFLLNEQRDQLLEMVDMGGLEIAPLFREHATRVRDLMRSYSPRMALADACIVRLSELHPAAQVLTTDAADFRIYRRNRTEKLPLIAP